MSFFFTLTVIFVAGVLLFFLCRKIHLPALIGYLLLGILLGFLEEKYGSDSFHFFAPELSAISSQIRKIALITILVKAGLSLNLKDLKKVGRPAVLMSFVPACTEMVCVGLFAPLFFDLSYTESFLLGSVLGAVSPAVVVPMMSKLMDTHYGTDKGVPQLIIAGSSIDDIIMIVFYQCFLTMEKGGSVSFLTFLNIPCSILTGVLLGVGFGFLFSLLFEKAHIRDSIKLILIFGISFGLTYLENAVAPYFGFSSLLAVISFCVVLNTRNKVQAQRLAQRCSKLWVLAEIFLFVLVGASIRIEYASEYFFLALALIAISLAFRSIGVSLCLIKTKLNVKERLFTVFSYLPKATVQAAIGGGLLDYGNELLAKGSERAGAVIASGRIVLSVSVVAILITAPLGAILMNATYKKLLQKEETEELPTE